MFETYGYPMKENKDIRVLIFFKETIEGYDGISFCAPEHIFSKQMGHQTFCPDIVKKYKIKIKRKLQKDDNIYIWAKEFAREGHITLSFFKDPDDAIIAVLPEIITPLQIESSRIFEPFLKGIRNGDAAQYDTKGNPVPEPYIASGKDYCDFIEKYALKNEKTFKSL